ncbi:MAG: iron-containing alcohol dehydrogenase [Coprothermobacterota bacterium]|nr:iron-containing alcohol dehydrogenase [Coprothermobacterota bacterium]
MRFEFATAGRVLFGPGVLSELGPAARSFGTHALVTLGGEAERGRQALDLLAAQGVKTFPYPVRGEPTLEMVRQAVCLGHEAEVHLVVGFGGGSVLDLAKAAAALLTNEGDPLDYLEVIGGGQFLRQPSLPVIAIPTTSGSGSEATRNAVLFSPTDRVKASLRSPTLLPRLALVDPSLTVSLPPQLTASTGLDALTQLIEPFLSRWVNPLVEALCREGMARSAQSLRAAYYDGMNLAAREDLALASLLGGMALANAGLGAVHGLAAAIGGIFTAPHGAVCARLLPLVFEANWYAVQMRASQEILTRFREVAAVLTGKPQAAVEEAINWLTGLVVELQIPGLASYGIAPGDFPALVGQAARTSSMQGNPVLLEPDELSQVLASAL